MAGRAGQGWAGWPMGGGGAGWAGWVRARARIGWWVLVGKGLARWMGWWDGMGWLLGTFIPPEMAKPKMANVFAE